MRKIKVNAFIFGLVAADNMTLGQEAGQIIYEYVGECPAEGLRIEGKNFILTITPLRSAAGRQEWFVEIVDDMPHGSMFMCIYNVRKHSLIVHFSVGRKNG